MIHVKFIFWPKQNKWKHTQIILNKKKINFWPMTGEIISHLKCQRMQKRKAVWNIYCIVELQCSQKLKWTSYNFCIIKLITYISVLFLGNYIQRKLILVSLKMFHLIIPNGRVCTWFLSEAHLVRRERSHWILSQGPPQRSNLFSPHPPALALSTQPNWDSHQCTEFSDSSRKHFKTRVLLDCLKATEPELFTQPSCVSASKKAWPCALF